MLSGDHEEKSAELCLAGTLHVGKGRLLIGGFTYFSVGTPDFKTNTQLYLYHSISIYIYILYILEMR